MKNFTKLILQSIITLFLLLFQCIPVVAADDKIHTAFCIDNNYPLYTMLAINSILLNNTSNSKYFFHIVENDLSKWNKFQMKHFVKNRGADIEFIHFDTKEIDGNENPFNNPLVVMARHVTRIGTARIMLPELLPDLDKILYLDADILVDTDLKDLWETDLKQYFAGMVDNDIGMNSDKTYFNSGVILINAPKWRKNNISDKLSAYIKTKDLSYPDQDAINYILRGKIKRLDYNYNFRVWVHYAPFMNKEVKCPPKTIYHYASNDKPWKLLFSRDNYTKIYLDYWNKSYLIIYKPLHLLFWLQKIKLSLARKFYKNMYFSYLELINKF